MCRICGCGGGEARLESVEQRDHEHRHDHSHGHDHGDHAHEGHSHADHGENDAGETRLVEIEADILTKNQGYADDNRRLLDEHEMLGINLISSPGAGKTTLLVATIRALKANLPVAVIEGDQETATDAERIRATGVPALQINTGRGCHLDAHMVGHALDGLPLTRGGVLFIENVGNLVCPVGFDLGEAHRITILSVAEGDDKPIKYPDAFASADLLILSKIDLLPHCDFDVEACLDHVRALNPDIAVVQLSARTGFGMTAWLDWLEAARQRALLSAGRDLADRLTAFRAIAGSV